MMNEKADEQMKGITLLGLGPGDPHTLTRAAWDWLLQLDKLHLRTRQHPNISGLPGHLSLVSFDDHYETAESFEKVYAGIIETILELGRSPEGVTYAVPGHPFVAEATCPEIARRATAEGIPCQVIDGLSFLEPTFRALGVDPLPELILVDALELALRETPGFPPSAPAIIAQIYDRQTAAEVKLTLMTAYPDDHPVRLVHTAGTVAELVEDLPLHAIDHSPHLGLLSSLYVSPLSQYASFEAFQEIIARLRAPDGCPWDREQTHLSLRPFLLEEAYEALDALDREDLTDLAEELGDLILQIVLHAQIASEAGDFNIHQVLEGIATKLVRRHPHVFAEVDVVGISGVTRNWEVIKAEERKEHDVPEKKGLLDGIPMALPALSQAAEIVERVGRVGFDDFSKQDSSREMMALIHSLEESRKDHHKETLGLLLLQAASLAHELDIDPESALREALTRFRSRFSAMESHVLAEGRALADLSSEQLENLWVQVGNQQAGEDRR